MANNQTPIKSAGFNAVPSPNKEPKVKIHSNNEYEIDGKRTSDYNVMKSILASNVEKTGKKTIEIEYDLKNTEYQMVFNVISICQKNEWGFNFNFPEIQKNINTVK